MDRRVRTFDSHADADASEVDVYASMTPDERLDLLLDMIARETEALGEAARRLARVHRVVDLARS